LRGSGAEELPNDVELVLDTLIQNPTLRVGDDSTPDQIREVFGISKKAFKRVLGVLLKRGQIEFDASGFARVVRLGK
jgi:predicted RNA-binding protein (virulence factor B family)